MGFSFAASLGLALTLVFILYSCVNNEKRKSIRARLGLNGESSRKSRPAATDPEYKDVFPPSRRSALVDIIEQLPPKHRLRQRSLASLHEGAGQAATNLVHVPLQRPNEQLQGHEVTPTGFTVEEIRLLGDFPDYAKLSGIPLPQAYDDFDIKRALARPYRPFRWAYYQTMSLTKLEPDWWIELEREYAAKIEQRKTLFAENGPVVLQHLPGCEMACKELMEIVLQFLCARYPMHFSLIPEKSHDTKEHCTMVFENRILGVTTRLDGSLHPLKVLLEHVPEDFAVMMREPETGLYHFRAGIICSSLGWSLGSKIGKKLAQVHAPVPDYDAKMRFSMDRYFAKTPTDRGIQRGSWGFEIDRPLFMAPGDPAEAHRLEQDEGLQVERVHLRVDWQTLRRLPLTGAVVFNFKALFTPLKEFRDEAYVPALVLKVLGDGHSGIMKYKNAWHTKHVVIPALEAWAREQEERGITEKGWQVRTLDESPWFPEWEKKWKMQQGFWDAR